jgi:hypothetical protein
MLPSSDAHVLTPWTIVKLANTSARPTNGNGQARNAGNGRRRRVRHQIRNGYRHAAEAADTAVLLVKGGMSATTEAIRRCGTNTNAFSAMKAIIECGSAALHDAVLRGGEPLLAAGARVKNAAAAITAFQKCSKSERGLFWLATGATDEPVRLLSSLTPDQLVATSKTLGLDWVWDRMIAPAMEVAEATTEPTNFTAVNGGDRAVPVSVEELRP